MEISVEIAALDWLRWKKNLPKTSADRSDALISVRRFGWWNKTYAVHVPTAPFSEVKRLTTHVSSLLECVQDSPQLNQLHQICVTFRFAETQEAARVAGPAFFWNQGRAEHARASIKAWWLARLEWGEQIAELPNDDGTKVMFRPRERTCSIYWRSDSEGVSIRLAANKGEVLAQFFEQLSWLLGGGLWSGRP